VIVWPSAYCDLYLWLVTGPHVLLTCLILLRTLQIHYASFTDPTALHAESSCRSELTPTKETGHLIPKCQWWVDQYPYVVLKARTWISRIWFHFASFEKTRCMSPNTWYNWMKSSAVVRNENLQGAFACARKMRFPNGKPAVALSIRTQIKYWSEYYDTVTNAEGMVFLELSKSFGFGFSGKWSDLSLLSSKPAVTPSVLP